MLAFSSYASPEQALVTVFCEHRVISHAYTKFRKFRDRLRHYQHCN
jgi:hypothetical protein